MNTDKLEDELAAKKRTVDDLIRQLDNRVDNNPCYSLLLGAGCSITSNIESGQQLIDKWKKEIYLSLIGEVDEYDSATATSYLKQKESKWYSEGNEYATLFEKKYDLKAQRRSFIERLVDKKFPSIGYAYLVNLVKEGFFNTIFTTNFDDLLNESFYQYSEERAMLCAHDSSVTSVNVTSSRPKIIKLHGDYLYDDIKSTETETESLGDNIRKKFIEFSKNNGLIVIGYAGNDRSVMDVFNYLLKRDEYMTSGIYWCLQKGSCISEELVKLLWKERVYFVIIDGFDELFAEINNSIVKKFPIENTLVSNKTTKIIQSYLDNKFLADSQSKIIQGDLKKLRSQTNKNRFSELLQTITDKGEDSLDDMQLFSALKLRSHMKNHEYQEAIDYGKKEIALGQSDEQKFMIYQCLADAYHKIGDDNEALSFYNKVIDIDPNDPDAYISKSKIITNPKKRLYLLDMAIEKSPYYYDSYDEKGLLLEDMWKFPIDQSEDDLYRDIIDNYEKSIEVFPSYKNPSWYSIASFIINSNDSEVSKKNKLIDLSQRLIKQGKDKPRVIRVRNIISVAIKDNVYTDQLISDIKNIISVTKSKKRFSYKKLLLKTLIDAGEGKYLNEMKQAISEVDIDNKKECDAGASYLLAEAYGDKLADISKAINILSPIYKTENTISIPRQLIIFHAILDNWDEAIGVYNNVKGNLDKESADKLWYDLNAAFDNAVEMLPLLHEKQSQATNPDMHVSQIAYYLMMSGKHQKAHDLLKTFLSKVNFNKRYVTEIVNYELSSTKINKKVDKPRLLSLLDNEDSSIAKAAIHALLDDKDSCFKCIKKSIESDFTNIQSARTWLVFKKYRNESRYKELVDGRLSSIEIKGDVAIKL